MYRFFYLNESMSFFSTPVFAKMSPCNTLGAKNTLFPAVETVLVTGGCGFIRSHTAKELLTRGCRVMVVDELNDYYDMLIKECNLRELKSGARQRTSSRSTKGTSGTRSSSSPYLSGSAPNGLCHLAAQAGVRASLEDPRVYAHSNVVGTNNVLEMVRLFGCRSVAMASSSSVYGDRRKAGGAEDAPGDEDALAADGELVHAFRGMDLVVHQASSYPAIKVGCELLAYKFHALYRLPVACLRFFTVYGPEGCPDMAPLKFVDRISRGLQIDWYGDGGARKGRDVSFLFCVGCVLSVFCCL